MSRRPGDRALRALRVAVPGWLTARVLVLGALGLARFIVDHVEPARGGVAARVHEGLLVWDGSWYARIAREGYAALPDEGLRFFPLVPLLTRGVSEITRLGTRTALLVVSNASALVLGALLYELVRLEKRDDALARRAAWLIAIVPPAYVFVIGYSEATATLLAVAMFFCLRTRRWGWAVPAGLLAGLARPVGVLLGIPAAIEAFRDLRATSMRERTARLAAVLAPFAGAGMYLLWVGVRFGDWTLPVRVQQRARLRGAFANPLTTLYHAAQTLFDGRDSTTGLHLPWVVVLALLVVVVFRHWPASYGAFALAMLLFGVSSSTLNSIERYALSAFPFVLAVATLTSRAWLERAVLVLSGPVMVAYAVLVFLGVAIP